MTTNYPPDTCIPPHHVPETVRERMLAAMLRDALPILWREELSTRTNCHLRELIRQIELATLPPLRYSPDDYSLVERDTL